MLSLGYSGSCVPSVSLLYERRKEIMVSEFKTVWLDTKVLK